MGKRGKALTWAPDQTDAQFLAQRRQTPHKARTLAEAVKPMTWPELVALELMRQEDAAKKKQLRS